MKKIALCLIASWALMQVSAAEGDWLTDFSKAQTKAKAEKKMILLDFSGSDWCAGCVVLRKEVLDSPAFLEYAKDHLVLVDVDFPQRKSQPEEVKKANHDLAQKFMVDGFPTLVVLSSDGKELAKKEGYEGQSAKSFVAELQKLKSRS